ncbi:MAG: hypothetical protein EDM74_05640 [Armatimonadetes bacterium]|nr:MAG: hypothetical protein EDM74_05640 [Armatimonadota bacterium]
MRLGSAIAVGSRQVACHCVLMVRVDGPGVPGQMAPVSPSTGSKKHSVTLSSASTFETTSLRAL